MTTIDTARPRALPDEVAGPAAPGWWGMVLLILTEATLFGALISSYFYLRFLAPAWPPDGIPRPELALAGVGTVLLLGSSLPAHLADRAGRRGDARALRLWLLAALALGAAFLGIQAVEYARQPFSLATDAYGSLFFTITGFHGLHVVGALLLNLGVQLLAWRRGATRTVGSAMRNVALYWHFVDAVWVVVFAALYLSPYLG